MRSIVLALLFVLALPLAAAADVLLPGPRPPRPPRPRVTYVEQETDWNGLMGAAVFVALVALVVYDDRRRRGGGDIEL